MLFRRRFGPRNALLRRVLKHANMTALFRSPDSPPLPPVAPGPAPHGGPVVRATMQPNPAAPAGQAIGAVPPMPGIDSAPGMGFLISPAAPIIPAPITIPTIMPSSAPVIQTAPAEEEDDANWRRLQRILRGHEARRETEGESPADRKEPPTTADMQRAIAAAESPPSPGPEGERPSIPLEEAWPVQSSAPSREIEAELPSILAPDPGQEREVRTKLDQVTSGRPTDSSIEYHPPRRPRPAAPIQAAKTPRRPGQKPDVQRRPESPRPTRPETVPTEIGPLPADLWEYIGETPPAAQEAGQQSEPADLPATDSPPDNVMKAIAAAEAPPAPPPPARPGQVEQEVQAAQPGDQDSTTAPPSSPGVQRRQEPTADARPEATALSTEMPSPPVSSPTKETPPASEVAASGTAADGRTLAGPAEASAPPSSADDESVRRAIAAAEAPVGEPATPAAPPAGKGVQEPARRSGPPEIIARSPESPAAQPKLVPGAPDAEPGAADLAKRPPLPEAEPVQPRPADETTAVSDERLMRAIAAAEAPAPPPSPEIAMRPSYSPAPTGPAEHTEGSVVQAVQQEVTPPALDRRDSDQGREVVLATLPDEMAAAPAPLEPDHSVTEKGPAAPEAPTDAVMRAIAAAEASAKPPSVLRQGDSGSPARRAERPILPPVDVAEDRAVQTEKIVAATFPVDKTVEGVSRPAEVLSDGPVSADHSIEEGLPPVETAHRPASEDAVLRAIAAAEAPAEPTPPPASVEFTDFEQRPGATPATADASAIASGRPGVPPADDRIPSTPSRPDTGRDGPSAGEDQGRVQRAIAAAEAPSRPPSFLDQGTLGPARPFPKPPTSSGASPVTTAERIPSPARPDTGWDTPPAISREARIQRAIAAAEAPPSPAWSESDRTIFRPQAVPTQAPVTGSLLQDISSDMWQIASTPSTASAQLTQGPAAARTLIGSPAPAPLDSVVTPLAGPHTGAIMRAFDRQAMRPEPTPESETYALEESRPIEASRDSEQELVQRVVAEASSSADPTTAEGELEQDVDIDELARQVYSQIRRRIAVEWERGRGRQ